MSAELHKLTTYFGERDRSDGELLADELFALYGREHVRLSAMLRGIEGFGHHHGAHTELLLTLSEDLPVVSVAVDTPERIEALLPQVLAMKRRGLVTIERARLTAELPEDLQEQAKLTVFTGRGAQVGGRPAFATACELLRSTGVHGATVLGGVDGTRDGERARARLLGPNPEVPVLVIAVGSGEAIARAAMELELALGGPLMTLERVQVLRRDGERIGDLDAPEPILEHDPVWCQKLTVHSSEDDRVDGHPLHRVLVQRLRRERIAGATTLRGIWGFRGEEAPHGDRLWQSRRHAPVMTIAVDTHERIAAIFGVVEQVTAGSGLVTVETVPVRILPGVR
jgi:PII-like signaling protein